MTRDGAFRWLEIQEFATLFLSAILLTSCATPPLRNAYDPPPPEGAAFLVSEDNFSPARMFLIGGVSIYAAGIDGVPISDARDRGSNPLPLRPGLRQILVARTAGDGSGIVPVQFEARTGETYRIRHKVEYVEGIAIIFDVGRWFVWIEDQAGSRVTQAVEMTIQRTTQPYSIPIIIPRSK